RRRFASSGLGGRIAPRNAAVHEGHESAVLRRTLRTAAAIPGRPDDCGRRTALALVRSAPPALGACARLCVVGARDRRTRRPCARHERRTAAPLLSRGAL